MNLRLKNNIPFYFSEILSRYKNTGHFFATRRGGVSSLHLASLNAGRSVNDNPENINENRSRIAQAFAMHENQMLFPGQTHSSNVKRIEEFPGKPIENKDALITNRKEIMLCVQTADCAPVIFYDPHNHAIGIAHAGWRGATNGILANTVKAMQSAYGSIPSNMRIAIGPSIGPDVYEVGNDVAKRVRGYFSKTTGNRLLYDKNNEKFLFDLWEANKQQLLMAGAHESNIEVIGVCTYSNPEHFYSARLNQGKTGRLASGIFLK